MKGIAAGKLVKEKTEVKSVGFQTEQIGALGEREVLI